MWRLVSVVQDWGLSLHVWSTPIPGPRSFCPSLGVGVDFLHSMTHGCIPGSLDKEVKQCAVVTALRVTFSS